MVSPQIPSTWANEPRDSRVRSAMRVATAAVTALALVAAQAPPVFAQGVNVTQAESLYDQGAQLIKEKKYHEACERFSASLKLDESINTMVALARCQDLDGKTASAWGEYLVAAKKGRGTPAGQYAADKAKELEGRLLKIRISMALVPPNVTIKIDNESIPPESLNADLPLDPGDHDIELTAPGKHDWARHITLKQNNSPLAVTVSMEDMTPEELKAQKQKQNGGIGPTGPQVVEQPGSPTRRWIGVGVGVVGVGALVYGVVALVQASDNQSKFNQEGKGLPTCDLPNGRSGASNTSFSSGGNCHVTDTSGLTFGDRANRFYIQMGVAGGIGIVAIGVGLALVLTSFGSKRVVKSEGADVSFAPMLGPGLGGMMLHGSF